MSFRLFVYYSTLIGAWAALVAWALARLLAPGTAVAGAVIYTLFLALTVAFGLSLVDALWNFRPTQLLSILGRVAAAMFFALLGAAACGGLGGLVSLYAPRLIFLVVWIGLGFLVGLSISLFDTFAGLARKDVRRPLAKLLKCVAGGTVGGLLGGGIAFVLRFYVGELLGDDGGNTLWAPTEFGFVILGGSIGLLVGLSQVFLLEAWIKVESGFRAGRDLILSRERSVIGRAEGSDIALFGDNGVEKQHALILLDHGAYYLEPLPDTPGTYINEQPVSARTKLVTGDLIRVGKSLLRFNQRRKR
jgi:hypothetical protein